MARPPRLRFTIASLMIFSAVLSLFLAATLPLIRWGKPPCLTTGQTIRWLAKAPGSASCTSCHAAVASPVAALLRPQFAPQGCAGWNGMTSPAKASCISCHSAKPRS